MSNNKTCCQCSTKCYNQDNDLQGLSSSSYLFKTLIPLFPKPLYTQDINISSDVSVLCLSCISHLLIFHKYRESILMTGNNITQYPALGPALAPTHTPAPAPTTTPAPATSTGIIKWKHKKNFSQFKVTSPIRKPKSMKRLFSTMWDDDIVLDSPEKEEPKKVKKARQSEIISSEDDEEDDGAYRLTPDMDLIKKLRNMGSKF